MNFSLPHAFHWLVIIHERASDNCSWLLLVAVKKAQEVKVYSSHKTLGWKKGKCTSSHNSRSKAYNLHDSLGIFTTFLGLCRFYFNTGQLVYWSPFTKSGIHKHKNETLQNHLLSNKGKVILHTSSKNGLTCFLVPTASFRKVYFTVMTATRKSKVTYMHVQFSFFLGDPLLGLFFGFLNLLHFSIL